MRQETTMKRYSQNSTDTRLFAALIVVALGWAAGSVAWDQVSMRESARSDRAVVQSAQAAARVAAQAAAQAAVQVAAPVAAHSF
jgi:uncharacterized protein HemX